MQMLTELIESKRFNHLLNWLRKRRTMSFKIAFSALIIEDIITGKKPHELSFWQDIDIIAVLGVVLIFTGSLIRLWAKGHFVKGKLFTSGPYAIIRHPLYLGSTIIMLGVLCILNDWFNWTVIVPMIILFHGAAIFCEEKSLETRFGRQWHDYKSAVPAIIPSVRRRLLLNSADKWSWQVYCNTTEKMATAFFLGLPVFLELLEESMFH